MSDMRDVILNQAGQIARSLEVNKDVKVEGDFDSIILAGMGGSGHPGDLINALGISKVPLYVHRNYDLPLDYLNHMGLNTPLIITSSYSGNTEETLTAYQQARDRQLPILASASGGQLQEQAKRDNVPFCLIDFPGLQPRHTLFAATVGIVTALTNSNLADNISNELAACVTTLNRITPTLEEPGQQLATQIKDKIPVYLSSDTLGFAAKNFKIQTNENGKYPAFWNTFPELNHNELVGFSKLAATQNPNKFIAVIINSADDHPRVKTRMQVTADLYQQWGADVAQIEAIGNSKLAQLFTTVTLGLWTTMYLAKSYGIDPVPVDGVEDFKAKLQDIAGEI